jgi:hypothetical protein
MNQTLPTPITTLLAVLALGACGAEKNSSATPDGWGDAAVDTLADPDGFTDVPADTLADPDSLPDVPVDVEEEPCAATQLSAELGIAPVDIIWVVDSSGSMDYEMHAVRDNLNDFAYQISIAGIVHHVILIGNAGEMSVPGPLGTGPNFMHIDDSVDSNAGLEKLVEHYPTYAPFLRPGAIRHFVAVSDDESDMSSGDFIATVAGWSSPGFPPNPAQPHGFTFHSIVSFGSVPIIGCITGAAVGRQYLNLSDLTYGVKEQVCQTDWSPIFSALETAIGVATVLPCRYDIPDPPAGETLELNAVNLEFTPTGGTTITIPRVDSESACVDYGWFYDDPADPTQIVLCPITCTIVQADVTGQINVAYGCATVII